MSKKVLIALDLDSELYKRYTHEGAEITIKKPGEVTPLDVADKEIIVGNIKPALVADAKKLELLQLNSAGYDNYVKVVPSHVKLCCCVGAFSPALSEHLLAMTFSLIRHFHLYRDKQQNKDWSNCGKIISVEGSTIAVFGLGDIGKAYARKVKALGAKRVIGVKRNLKDKPDYVDEVYTLSDVDKFVGDCDLIANVMPSSPETTQFFNEAFFKKMKQGSYFMNVGRGDAVNQEDLISALQHGPLKGAALDVTTPEPLPKDSPLWECQNLLLTPHVAGWFFLRETVERIVNISSTNMKNFIDGNLPLKNEIAH